MRSKLCLTALAVVAMACSGAWEATRTVDNVLLTEWTGPYEGVPAFDKMNLDDLKPALEHGMAKNLEEIDSIAGNPDPPTFENTIVELERVGRDLSRVLAFWSIWSSNLSTPEFRAIQTEMAPKLSEFRPKSSRTRRCSIAFGRYSRATRWTPCAPTSNA